MSMAHSLEARTLFLDHKIFELAATIPAGLKMRGGIQKYILKKAVKDLLPPEILNREKAGFALPTELWLRGPLKHVMRETVEWAGSHGAIT
jgi:asparagine synthase (glutamine-hydrolysing)